MKIRHLKNAIPGMRPTLAMRPKRAVNCCAEGVNTNQLKEVNDG